MRETDLKEIGPDRFANSSPGADTDAVEDMEALRARVRQLEADNAAMRDIVQRVAEARMARDPVTQLESCLHCSLKRGGKHGYSGKHAENCIVTRARALGF